MIKEESLNNILENNRKINQRITMVAVIQKGGKILSIGINDYFRLCYKFKDRNQYGEYQGLHAELAAIKKCTKKQLQGSIMSVYGQTVQGNFPKSTRPCCNCLNAIKAVGIRKIVYYENGLEIKETIK
jgi:deoxycytidylate deaminase